MAEASRWHRGGAPKPKLHYRKEVEIRTTLQELSLYFIFLINLCILTFGMVNPHMYYLNKVMSSLFLDTSVPGDERTNFKSIHSITDFWKFMEGPLLEGLYWDAWYTNKTLYNLKNSSRIYYENILLGVPRVRQLRVRNNTCKVYSSFQSLMSECYDKYTSSNEDTSDFGLKQETEWKYSTPNSSSPWHWGFVGVYRNGGFIFTLPKSKSDTKNKFINLRLNSWITRGTRVIFIDFSLYNANVNLFCIIRFAQFRIVLGDFNFAGIQQANRILGPIYFITFIFFVFFVLLNMFLAIINDTYSEVKADYSIGRRPDFELGEMIKKSYNNALEKLRLKKPQKDEDDKGMKGDLAEQARREGFDENEIQSAEQMKKWKERLEKKYYSSEIQDDYQPVTQQEFRELFLYAVELEKELHYVSLKLNRVMRRISALQN
ncbi:polycystic kidney disease 2-like 2 protein isoform X2 [Leopardus geoffroyi]|uniref:polycystic kidney disease 2-like 2 protein isoform X2 n=1 Tax=Leopardus geoffroyi TaxID=46844 RepID=UPI001E25E212|nr:polycystic kidney disease 2-like 2 protein isoform X2 [Leopardus geoffroyi]